ncbi:SAM-dependent methyltransferase [Propionibacteriaceae bacterium Y1685]|uniref:SAM-dependent methyltransferase n=1 Tax=Microlunatus sp. Y1700 TaxID=3418487 RepID=UPI003B815CC6
MTEALDALRDHPRHQRANKYDPAWVRSLDMGPHPLWQLEELLRDMSVEPGMRVLDLGCGKGASAVFLAREFGVDVVAFDAWIGAEEIDRVCAEVGASDRVTAVQGDVRQLPFDDDHFDAVVSIDAFEYFGTDVHLLPALLRVLRPGGRLGMSTPALARDPYEHEPSERLRTTLGWEVAAWHSAAWWRRHWELSGLVNDVSARWAPGGHHDWLAWARLGDADPMADLLQSDTDEEIGFAVVSATKT